MDKSKDHKVKKTETSELHRELLNYQNYTRGDGGQTRGQSVLHSEILCDTV